MIVKPEDVNCSFTKLSPRSLPPLLKSNPPFPVIRYMDPLASAAEP